MSQYVNSIYNGRRDASLKPTKDAAQGALQMSLDKHEARGERSKVYMYGPRFVVEIWDRDGGTIGKYWLSDEKDSPEPTERDGPRVKV